MENNSTKTKNKCHHNKCHQNDSKKEELKEEKCTCEQSECDCPNDDINDERELLGKRIKQLEESLLRNQAELLNYRKRKDEETSRIVKYAEEEVLKSFLPILDNFERAINMDDDNLNDEVSKFLEGFKLMYKQIKELLKKFEVTEIDSLGKEFDPSYHQAVVMDKDDTKEHGIITEVLQKGYMYKDRVLRTAMVKVNAVSYTHLTLPTILRV